MKIDICGYEVIIDKEGGGMSAPVCKNHQQCQLQYWHDGQVMCGAPGRMGGCGFQCYAVSDDTETRAEVKVRVKGEPAMICPNCCESVDGRPGSFSSLEAKPL